jgi:hypothetical protein
VLLWFPQGSFVDDKFDRSGKPVEVPVPGDFDIARHSPMYFGTVTVDADDLE